MPKKPKMILFDYGHTLLCEPDFSFLRGNEALFEYIKNNKNGWTPNQVNDFLMALYEKTSVVREAGIQLPGLRLQRFLYEYLEIEFSIPFTEVEKILWNNTSVGALMPNVDTMLDYINASGIRTGVISNIGWSGVALAERINRLLPNNKFELVMASSEYIFRKPDHMLFEIALKKAGLGAEDVWFCGDNIKEDVEGSAAVGIFPVWYENEIIEKPWRGKNESIIPCCEHLHINDWHELIEILENCVDAN